jgi:hypothetical protein
MELETNQEKSSHGGARPGAGRKPGSLNSRTRAIAEKCIAEGTTPLEVLIAAMTEAYQAKDYESACKYAKDAAPYIHPRLANVELSGDSENPIEMRFGWMK